MIEQRHLVTPQDTAAAVGSGDLSVLGTPRLLAWLEEATCLAVGELLDSGQTSVGMLVRLEHLAPSPVGAEVICSAEVLQREGRRVTCAVRARHTDGTTIAQGEVARAIVDADRFIARLMGESS